MKTFIYIAIGIICLCSYVTKMEAKARTVPDLGNIARGLTKFVFEELENGFIGLALDEQDRKVMQQSSPRTVDRIDRQEPLTLNDVIKLSESGVSDNTIIQYMKDTASEYNLSQSQVKRLQEAGVSQRVINYMVRRS